MPAIIPAIIPAAALGPTLAALPPGARVPLPLGAAVLAEVTTGTGRVEDVTVTITAERESMLTDFEPDTAFGGATTSVVAGVRCSSPTYSLLAARHWGSGWRRGRRCCCCSSLRSGVSLGKGRTLVSRLLQTALLVSRSLPPPPPSSSL